MRQDEISRLKFLVLGAARSGLAAATLLNHSKADVVVADETSAPERQDLIRSEMEPLNIPVYFAPNEIAASIERCDVVVKSPGIPRENQFLQQAISGCKRIVSEIELAQSYVSPATKTVAITGTNGKTTTTAWIAHILAKGGFNAVAVGNIGEAWCNSVGHSENRGADTVFVVEASSFQLEDIESFKPDVAVLTNLSPDHMDRYGDSMEQYVAAKRNLIRNMGSSDVFVFNGCDSGCVEFAKGFPGIARAFCSVDSDSGQGVDCAAKVIDGQLMMVKSGKWTSVISVAELPLPGRHNLENAMAAALACGAIDVEFDALAAGLRSFPGVEHRIELCGTRHDGVRFFNDSKATNLDSTEKALQAFDQRIVLIAGGRDAHSDYAAINDLVKQHVQSLITLGEAAPLIEATWGTIVPTRRAASMEEAVTMANEMALTGDVVLFSPACKSFDMYNDYEERGRDFKEKVAKLLH